MFDGVLGCRLRDGIDARGSGEKEGDGNGYEVRNAEDPNMKSAARRATAIRFGRRCDDWLAVISALMLMKYGGAPGEWSGG